MPLQCFSRCDSRHKMVDCSQANATYGYDAYPPNWECARSHRLEFASAFGGGSDMDRWLAPIVSGAIDPNRS
jgi:hypothetical protein